MHYFFLTVQHFKCKLKKYKNVLPEVIHSTPFVHVESEKSQTQKINNNEILIAADILSNYLTSRLCMAFDSKGPLTKINNNWSIKFSKSIYLYSLKPTQVTRASGEESTRKQNEKKRN